MEPGFFVCQHCGQHNAGHLAACERCRAPRMTPPAQAPYVAPVQSGYPPPPQGYGYPPPPQGQGYGYPPPPQGYPYPAPQHPPPQPPSLAALAAQLPPTPPEVENLAYGSKLAIPNLCACCGGPATTAVETDAVRTGSQRIAWFKFPHCKACARHITWSGRPGTGPVRFFGLLFMAAGALGGLALTQGDHAEPQSRGVAMVLLAVVGYVVAMIVAALLGRVFGPRTPACTSRGRSVALTRVAGGYQFRFTNRLFDQAFRSMNTGTQPIDMQALLRRMSGKK